MSVSKLKTIRYILTATMGMMFFLGMQFVTDPSGKETTFFESVFIALLAIGLNLSMWSNWLYNLLAEENIKINYSFFQVLGILTVLLFIYIITMTVYNEVF